MKEIVTLACGQAGNQIATEFWQHVIKEHALGLDGQALPDARPDQHRRLDVFFSQASSNRWVPRSLCIDLEPNAIDVIRQGPLGKVHRPDAYINGQSGAGNNFAKGYYTDGAELVDQILENVRKEVERAEMLQGFQIVQSLGGGTGSGLGTLILSKLREEYPDRIAASWSLLPGTTASETIVESYNAALCLHQLVEMADLTFILDNDALYNICAKTLKTTSPRYEDLNALIANVMSGVTTTLRFPGQLNADLRKLAVNLVPFPRLHFVMSGYAPLTSLRSAGFQRSSVEDLTQQVFTPQSMMIAADPRLGRYLTAALVFRGERVSSQEVEQSMATVQQRNAGYFTPWIPNGVMTSLCNVAPLNSPMSATFMGNSTAQQEVFKRLLNNFSAMFRRRAFMHWYTLEGMDEMEFTEAESNLLDLVAEYQQYADEEVTDDDDVDGGAEAEVEAEVDA